MRNSECGMGRDARRLHSAFRIRHSALIWSPRLVARQRLLLFREALICLSYSGMVAPDSQAVGRTKVGPSAR